MIHRTTGPALRAQCSLRGNRSDGGALIAEGFTCDGSFGIQIRPDVWHQPVFPTAPRASFDNKQGAVHACVAIDFVVEYSCYLSVSLRPEAVAAAPRRRK